jgi:hypothetical protein
MIYHGDHLSIVLLEYSTVINIMKWFIIFWCCQVVVTFNSFVTNNADVDATRSDVESLSNGDIDDNDIPNIIFIPVGLNGDTNVVTFRLAIEDYGYSEMMLRAYLCVIADEDRSVIFIIDVTVRVGITREVVVSCSTEFCWIIIVW